MKDQIININLCVTDLQKDLMRKGNDNKVYINLVCAPKKEADRFGNTHSVYHSQTKEQRTAKDPKIYCGSATEMIFNQAPVTDQDLNNLPK